MSKNDHIIVATCGLLLSIIIIICWRYFICLLKNLALKKPPEYREKNRKKKGNKKKCKVRKEASSGLRLFCPDAQNPEKILVQKWRLSNRELIYQSFDLVSAFRLPELAVKCGDVQKQCASDMIAI